MQLSLSLGSMLSLFLVMLLLAAIPGVSVLTVCARTVSFGFSHGLLATLGIVSGDIIFILLAVFGLALLVETLGQYFVLIQLLGGVYLLWLAVSLLKDHSMQTHNPHMKQASLRSSYLSGLMVTLPDQKAILFYMGLFPAFVDMAKLTLLDSLLLVTLAAIAIASPKLAYACMANRLQLRFANSRGMRALYYMAATLLLGVGIMLILSALGLFS